MWVLIFSVTFLRNVSYYKKDLARCDHKCNIGLHLKYQILFLYFGEIRIFSTDFRKILQYQISPKFVQLEPNFLCGRTDKIQTGKPKRVGTFRNFTEEHKMFGYGS